MSPDKSFMSLFAACLFACSASSVRTDAGAGNACTPGAAAACACTDGQSGAQTCAADGTFAPCVCTSGSAPDAGPTPDAGLSNLCVPGASAACTCTDGASGAQTCLADGTFAVCVCAPFDAGAPSGGGIASQVSIVGDLNPAGVVVSLQGAGLDTATTTDADGGYSFSDVPAGVFTLSFSKSEALPGGGSVQFGATLPELLYLPGSNGFIVESSLYPLAPIDLPALSQSLAGSNFNSLSSTPDGSRIVYQVDLIGQPDALVVQELPAGTPRVVAAPIASFQLSQDGSELVYLDSANTLWAMPITGAPVQLLTNFQGQYQLSPDGSRISYTSGIRDPDGYEAVFVVSSAGGAALQLDPAATDPGVFSPDSSQVALLDNGFTLTVAPVDGGSPVAYAGRSYSDQAPIFEFSPDSQHVMFETLNPYTLYTASTSAPAETSVGVSLVQDAFFSFTPDSSRIVFSLNGALSVAPLSGASPTTLVPSGVTWFLLSPDGTQVLFLTDLNSSNLAGC